MEMTGERRIPAPRQRVWEALNDPEVLQACVPGCESIERTENDQLHARVAIKIGSIAARLNGRVQLSDIEPAKSYKLSGEGQGGAVGFAKGSATVNLADDNGGTLLHYRVSSQVGGKLAQLGARLIDATAKQLSDQFFDRFTQRLTLEVPSAPVAPLAGDAKPPPPTPEPATINLLNLLPREPYGLPMVAWVGIVIFAAIFILIFSAYL